jgi:hypothetical protein
MLIQKLSRFDSIIAREVTFAEFCNNIGHQHALPHRGSNSRFTSISGHWQTALVVATRLRFEGLTT